MCRKDTTTYTCKAGCCNTPAAVIEVEENFTLSQLGRQMYGEMLIRDGQTCGTVLAGTHEQRKHKSEICRQPTCPGNDYDSCQE
jgi:hypothetical protein